VPSTKQHRLLACRSNQLDLSGSGSSTLGPDLRMAGPGQPRGASNRSDRQKSSIFAAPSLALTP
jgi:hypothetical protein